MKILTYCTLILMFCGIGGLSVHPDDELSHASRADILPLEQYSVKHQELLKEAKEMFEEHPLTKEWVPLNLRIKSEGTQYLSDIERVYELKIRMLTDIDAEQHVKQIQQHQEALKHCKNLHKVIGDQRLKKPITTTKVWDIAYKTFFELLPDNSEAARTALDIFAVMAFKNHRLTKEWKELFFRLCRDKKAFHSEAIRVFELKKQMLTDIDAKRHAKEIKNLADVIKESNRVQKILERQGYPDEKMTFNFAPK